MSDELAPTGSAGLDEILRGVLPPHQMYIIPLLASYVQSLARPDGDLSNIRCSP